MIRYFILHCPLAKQEVTLFLDSEWARKKSSSLLDVSVCLEGRMGRCKCPDCRFHKDSAANTRNSPFSEDTVGDLLAGQKLSDKPKHRPPERLRHVFDAFGIDPKNTPEQARLLKDGSGFVYIIKCNDLVKIGVAEDIDKRMATLQVGNPYALELLNSVFSLAPVMEEQKLHDLLARHRLRGEWFELPPEVIEELKQIENIEEYTSNKSVDHYDSSAADGG